MTTLHLRAKEWEAEWLRQGIAQGMERGLAQERSLLHEHGGAQVRRRGGRGAGPPPGVGVGRRGASGDRHPDHRLRRRCGAARPRSPARRRLRLPSPPFTTFSLGRRVPAVRPDHRQGDVAFEAIAADFRRRTGPEPVSRPATDHSAEQPDNPCATKPDRLICCQKCRSPARGLCAFFPAPAGAARSASPNRCPSRLRLRRTTCSIPGGKRVRSSGHADPSRPRDRCPEGRVLDIRWPRRARIASSSRSCASTIPDSRSTRTGPRAASGCRTTRTSMVARSPAL